MKWEDAITEISLAGGPIRLRLVIRGRVQGVGFRPSVYRFARDAGVGGYVQNTVGGVVVEVEGPSGAVNDFGRRLTDELPPLARIDGIDIAAVEPAGEKVFTIRGSEDPGITDALYPVDSAVCEDCLREMGDPRDRRYRYPFINCTNCGPRFTIIEGLPYDRPLTTMREFTMDDFCRAQYENAHDRRFHAEPISCPLCGPRLSLVNERGDVMEGEPLDEARRLLLEGAVVAVKGIGGYHLACLAGDHDVVDRLRRRKKRPAKPFAVMFRSLQAVERHCLVDQAERRLLLSPEAPIVLLLRKGNGLPESIAPRNGYIGAFLPYTPLHHLLMEGFDALVMTSANCTDEPLVSNEVELTGILGSMADAALVHNRRIAHKCDDSIFFVPSGAVVPLRRARGFVPDPIKLARPCAVTVLALGGQEKGTFALSKSDSAFVSAHLGDLGDARSQANMRRELAEFERLLDVRPGAVVCDMHPDYFTTRLAREIGGPNVIAVQHHHAHAVSVMVEYGLDEPVVAVTFDGTGYGSDGRLWGGEFILARYDGFERLAHLKYLPLPGGEAAIREPWRMALIHVWNAIGDGVLERSAVPAPGFEGLPAADVLKLARRSVNSPHTSSMGRLFDAAAYLLGCGPRVTYEAEAAVALEALALESAGTDRCYRFDRSGGDVVVIDPAPVFRRILDDLRSGVPPVEIAAALHNSVADLTWELSVELARRTGCANIVVSGGVFQNRFLVERLLRLAQRSPFHLYQHKLVPPNDGGLSLGQLQIGAVLIERGSV